MLWEIYRKEYSKAEWICAKISLVWIAAMFLLYTYSKYNSQPFPVGICTLIDCAAFMGFWGKTAFVSLLAILALCYVFEIKMIFTTLALAIVYLIGASLEESNGILSRTSLITAIFLGQWLAYVLLHFKVIHNVTKHAMQFSVQLVAASYTLAAISKITTAGFGWFLDGPYMSLQVLKSFSFDYFSSGDMAAMQAGEDFAAFVLNNAFIIKGMLLVSLILEATVVLALISRKWTVIYGVFLLGMHIGIKILMDILITAIAVPMMIFFLNPLYLIYYASSKCYRKWTDKESSYIAAKGYFCGVFKT